MHTGYAFGINGDFDRPGSATLVTEPACTSVTSGGAEWPSDRDTCRAVNPHLKFYGSSAATSA